MENRLNHITVCICTYRRPSFLRRLLDTLDRQHTYDVFTYSVVVADNDAAQSARAVVSEVVGTTTLEVHYCVERERNIALARNKALEYAYADLIAFIDDDEFPTEEWLFNLYRTMDTHRVAGVLGPVMPHFDFDPPNWLVRGGFFDRPTHLTGFVLPWQECRTGNVIFARSILATAESPFRPEFGSGGEDQDFFRRMIARGNCFIWCNEAVALETVPMTRWSRRFLLKRALLRGKNSLRHRTNRLRNLLKSAIAVPLYTLALPIGLLVGQHCFMKYSVKLADHFGRILALVGLNPVKERPM